MPYQRYSFPDIPENQIIDPNGLKIFLLKTTDHNELNDFLLELGQHIISSTEDNNRDEVAVLLHQKYIASCVHKQNQKFIQPRTLRTNERGAPILDSNSNEQYYTAEFKTSVRYWHYNPNALAKSPDNSPNQGLTITNTAQFAEMVSEFKKHPYFTKIKNSGYQNHNHGYAMALAARNAVIGAVDKKLISQLIKHFKLSFPRYDDAIFSKALKLLMLTYTARHLFTVVVLPPEVDFDLFQNLHNYFYEYLLSNITLWCNIPDYPDLQTLFGNHRLNQHINGQERRPFKGRARDIVQSANQISLDRLKIQIYRENQVVCTQNKLIEFLRILSLRHQLSVDDVEQRSMSEELSQSSNDESSVPFSFVNNPLPRSKCTKLIAPAILYPISEVVIIGAYLYIDFFNIEAPSWQLNPQHIVMLSLLGVDLVLSLERLVTLCLQKKQYTKKQCYPLIALLHLLVPVIFGVLSLVWFFQIPSNLMTYAAFGIFSLSLGLVCAFHRYEIGELLSPALMAICYSCNKKMPPASYVAHLKSWQFIIQESCTIVSIIFLFNILVNPLFLIGDNFEVIYTILTGKLLHTLSDTISVGSVFAAFMYASKKIIDKLKAYKRYDCILVIVLVFIALMATLAAIIPVLDLIYNIYYGFTSLGNNTRGGNTTTQASVQTSRIPNLHLLFRPDNSHLATITTNVTTNSLDSVLTVSMGIEWGAIIVLAILTKVVMILSSAASYSELEHMIVHFTRYLCCNCNHRAGVHVGVETSAEERLRVSGALFKEEQARQALLDQESNNLRSYGTAGVQPSSGNRVQYRERPDLPRPRREWTNTGSERANQKRL